MKESNAAQSGTRANRTRGVSFEDHVLTKPNNKKRNEVVSGRHVDKTGDTLSLQYNGALDKNLQLQKKYKGKGLRSLSLSGNKISGVSLTTAVDGKHQAKYMQLLVSSDRIDVGLTTSAMLELSIVHNHLESFLSKDVLECMPKLQRLILHDNKITRLPGDSLDTLGKFGNLEELNLGTNEITQLPAEIGRLTSLKKLKITNNKLEALPPEIVKLVGLYHQSDAFSIGGNELIAPPQTIAQLGGMEWIRAYFQLISSDGNIPSSERYRYSLVLHQLNHAANASGEKKIATTAPAGGSGKNLRRSHQLKIIVVGHKHSGKSDIVRNLREATHNHSHKGSEPAATAAPGPYRSFSNDHGTPVHGGALGKDSLHSTFELRSPPSFASPLAPPHLGFASPLSPESLPLTPSTCSSYTPSATAGHFFQSEEARDAVGVAISPWYPKKAALEPHILPAKLSDNKKMNKSLFSVQPHDVKFYFWELMGRWMPHSVYEMFFSEYALHLVAFDLSITATPLDCDVYVQYWIDLIQARAPGSTIVVVGTHADRLTAEQERDRVEMVKARIKSNEEQRVADLRKDVEGCRNADKRDTLRRTLEKRPVIDADILAMARGDAERVLADIHMLSCRIVQLATPTAAKPHPLSTINTVLPDFYLTVKDCMNVLKSENKAFCTVHELEQLILSKRAGSSGSLHDLAGERTGRSVLRETKMAVAHWANVGEIMWFPCGSEKSAQAEKEHATGGISDTTEEAGGQFLPLKRAMTGDFSPTEPAAQVTPAKSVPVEACPPKASAEASEVVFLDPDWLMGCIKLILDHDLIRDILSTDSYHVTRSEEALHAERMLAADKSNAQRGIIRWKYVRGFLHRDGYLQRRGCETAVIDALRVVLEKYRVIIPISVETAGGDVQQLLRAKSGPVGAAAATPFAQPGVPSSPAAPAASAMTSVTPQARAATVGARPSTSNLSRTFESMSHADRYRTAPSAVEEQHYLIPGLLPSDASGVEKSLNHLSSGAITLERTFHFNRLTPPGLIQAIFARTYALQDQVPVAAGASAPVNFCCAGAFVQRHAVVTIFVHLLPGGARIPVGGPAAAEAPSQEFSSHLRIKGVGHVLNAHAILEQLDKYTAVTQQVLEEYPGMGHVRLSSTCPDCLLNQSDESLRGKFRHSELVALKESFAVISDSVLKAPHGGVSSHVATQLRKWNSKRHTCPQNRCQIRSDMLIHVPRRIKTEIERVAKSEKEINFLLDEVVRSAAVPLSSIAKGVVKIMAANCQEGAIQLIQDRLGWPKESMPATATLVLDGLLYSSGVVVALPPDRAFSSSYRTWDGTDKVLVLSCEHVVTKKTAVAGKLQYTRINHAAGMQTTFIIGDATHWLYLAEMVFQGSKCQGSEMNFWDMCALRIIAPIQPILQRTHTGASEVDSVTVLMRTEGSDHQRASASPSPRILTSDEPERVDLLHPLLENSPMHSIVVSTRGVAVDQVVRRLGYPGFPAMLDLSVDCGRVEQNDPNGDILISLLSDDGASGGPVVDRDGQLIGLLSRSHDYVKYSCVQHLRNLFDVIDQL